MKSLIELSNEERAMILLSLFPQKKLQLIRFLEKSARVVLSKEPYPKPWQNAGITEDFWEALAMEIDAVLTEHNWGVTYYAEIFVDQLFVSNRSLFTIDALLRYARNHCTDVDFTIAVALLFSHPQDYSFSYHQSIAKNGSNGNN